MHAWDVRSKAHKTATRFETHACISMKCSNIETIMRKTNKDYPEKQPNNQTRRNTSHVKITPSKDQVNFWKKSKKTPKPSAELSSMPDDISASVGFQQKKWHCCFKESDKCRNCKLCTTQNIRWTNKDIMKVNMQAELCTIRTGKNNWWICIQNDDHGTIKCQKEISIVPNQLTLGRSRASLHSMVWIATLRRQEAAKKKKRRNI